MPLMDRSSSFPRVANFSGGNCLCAEKISEKCPHRRTWFACRGCWCGHEAGAAMSCKTVLVVDDHPDTADVLSRLLERNGYDAVPVHNGFEALSYLARHKPSAIVLDVMMPGMDGGALLRAMRENAALHDIPVVVFSGDFSY